MDPRPLGIFLALGLLLCALAHFAPKVAWYLAIAAAVLAGVVLVVDLANY